MRKVTDGFTAVELMLFRGTNRLFSPILTLWLIEWLRHFESRYMN